MSSSATNIGSSSDDPLHRSLALKVELGLSKFYEKLCLPVFQGSRERLTPKHINHIKKSGIDASTRLFNNTHVPPSSMLDPSLLMLTPDHDEMYADDFCLNLDTDTFVEEDAIPVPDNYGNHLALGHDPPAMAPSEGFIFLESLVAGSSASEWNQALEQALAADDAQRMAPSAPLALDSAPLAAPAVIDGVDTTHTSAQKQVPMAEHGLTPPDSPTPADTIGAGLSVLAGSDFVTDAAPEAASAVDAVDATAVSGKSAEDVTPAEDIHEEKIVVMWSRLRNGKQY